MRILQWNFVELAAAVVVNDVSGEGDLTIDVEVADDQLFQIGMKRRLVNYANQL